MKYISAWLIILAVSGLSTNYYVDNQHSGPGSGTFSDPFLSISAALPILAPGDTLFIRGGTHSPQIYSESITTVNAGTAEQRIVIKAYENELVEIQHGDPHVLRLNAGGYLFEGLILNHLNAQSDAVKVRSSYNTIRNCEIKNGRQDGIDQGSGDHNRYENNRIHDFISGTTDDAHGIVLDEGERTIIENNRIYNCNGDCIQIIHGTAHWTEILNNELYTLLQSGSENAIDIKTTLGVRIIGNVMHGFRRSAGSQGDALVVHHDADSIIIRENEIYDSNGGIRLNAASGGVPDYIWIERNLVHDLIDEGQSSVDGYGIQLDGTTHVIMYNNTFANIPGPLFWIDSDGASEVDIRNNLFANGGEFHGSQSNLSGNNIIAYNGWFNCAEMFQNQTNAVVGTDPLFVNPAAFDYHLQAGSPCIDAGDPSFGTNFPGGRIDLGAFEFDSVTGTDHLTTNPTDFQLYHNYPNPFNPITYIRFYLPYSAHVQLFIFNTAGEKVLRLVDETLPAGDHVIPFHPRYYSSQLMASGTYFYTLRTGQAQKTRKMVYLK